MSKTVAFIQARMSSSRFPGKVLEPLAGVPMIVYMARRVARAARLDAVVVATSAEGSDDALVDALTAAAVPVFRGHLNDVLTRFAEAARRHGADEVVRLTGDCPLIDPAVIDSVIEARRAAGADYASNCEPATFPDGLDVECFTHQALEQANRLADRMSDREHVTLWMRGETSGLRRVNHSAVADLSALRLTVDYPDDLEAVRQIVACLPEDGRFDLFDILRVMSQRPAIGALNAHARNEGLALSLAAERNTQP
jgi:spore coat polysaccharide biosynthesis protein SpsF